MPDANSLERRRRLFGIRPMLLGPRCHGSKAHVTFPLPAFPSVLRWFLMSDIDLLRPTDGTPLLFSRLRLEVPFSVGLRRPPRVQWPHNAASRLAGCSEGGILLGTSDSHCLLRIAASRALAPSTRDSGTRIKGLGLAVLVQVFWFV